MWCRVSSSTCSAGASRSSVARSSGPRRQVERAPGLLARPARAASASRRPAGSAREVDHRQRRAARPGAITLHAARRRRAAKVVRSASWRRDDLGEARARGPATSSAPSQPHGASGCCRRGLPGSSWSRNQSRCWAKDSGSVAVARHAARAAARPARSGAAGARLDPPRRAPATVGASNSARSGSSTPKAVAHPRDDLGGQQRVAAQLEEVVVRRPPARRRAPRPRCRPAAPRSACAAPRRLLAGGAGARPGRAAPCGPPCRWASAAARPGARRPTGTMYSGSRSPQEGAQLGRRRGAPAGRARRRPPAACRPARPRAPATTASRTAGWRGERGLDLAQLDAEAAHLDLVVERGPGTPASPSGRQRARSPVRYSRAPGLARRTDRGRSARPSAPAGRR